jgi:hypothetical protein
LVQCSIARSLVTEEDDSMKITMTANRFALALAAALLTVGGADVAVAAGNYDAYYDGAYGPFNDGYWGKDGNFWYTTNSSATIWKSDSGQHFQHVPASGFSHVEGSGLPRDHGMVAQGSPAAKVAGAN